MAIDVMVLKFDKIYQSVENIPANARTLCLGKRSEIKRIISSVFVGTDWSDFTGIWNSNDGSIVFNVSSEEYIDSFFLEVRVNDHAPIDSVFSMIVGMVQQNEWQAIEMCGSSFLES